MKLKSIRYFALIAAASLSAPFTNNAATVWNGPKISFIQANPYPGNGDRDQLTANVALTRGSASGGGTVPGSGATNQMDFPIDQNNGSVFYRLAVP